MNYIFDGSYQGFLTCVFESFEYKDSNIQLLVDGQDANQTTMFDKTKTIITDVVKATRVQKGLEKQLGYSVAKDFYRAFLSEDPKAWSAAFSIIGQLFSGKKTVLQNFGDSEVLYFAQTLKKVSRERHRMKAFIRFSKSSDGLFFAVIEPDFNVLPLITSFFKNRYTDQEWLIYDVKRKYGLLYNKQSIVEVKLSPEEKKALSTDTVINLDEKDLHFQNLWKSYFKSTNIAARRNMKLHLQFVPKRYWKYLVEKQV
jgi:probable DNA metabolism protein